MQVFSCEIYESFKNTFYLHLLRLTLSVAVFATPSVTSLMTLSEEKTSPLHASVLVWISYSRNLMVYKILYLGINKKLY